MASATLGKSDPGCISFEKAFKMAIDNCKLGPGGNTNVKKGAPWKKRFV